MREPSVLFNHLFRTELMELLHIQKLPPRSERRQKIRVSVIGERYRALAAQRHYNPY
jgi:hypothetical protein